MLEEDPFRYHPCTHAGTLKDLNRNQKHFQFEITAACDLQRERLDQFQSWWQEGMNLETDYKKVFYNNEIDLLIISSSFYSHYEICRYALNQKVKAVVLEKPAAETAEQIQELIDLSEKNRIPVWVNFERRYHNGYRNVKKMIEHTPKEELRSITGKVLTGRVREGDEGSPILLDGIHWLDLLIWFFGLPDVSGAHKIDAQIPAMHDTVFAEMMYDDVLVHFEAGGRRRYFEFFMEIDYEKTRVRTGNEGQFFHLTSPSERYKNFYELKEEKIQIEMNNPWIDMYKEIVDYFLNPDEVALPITSPLQDSEQSMKLLENILRR